MENETLENSSDFTEKSFYAKLKLIYTAILISPIAFILLMYVKVGETEFYVDTIDVTLLSALIALIITGYFIGTKIYNDRLMKISSMFSLKEKTQELMTASIIRFALLEGPALAGTAFFAISEDLVFLLAALIPILVLLSVRPNKLKIKLVLHLTKEEEKVYLEK